MMPLRLALLAALCLPGAAAAQTALPLEGACEKLVIAGRDLTASCTGTLTNAVARNRTTFDFASRDGQSLSFSGTGAQQERTEETDPLQPINLVTPAKAGEAGIVRTPTLAVGACAFSTPEPGKTRITCEANPPGQGTPDQAYFAGTFVTAARSAAEPGAKGGAEPGAEAPR